MFGVLPSRTFRQAATKFLLQNLHLHSISDYAIHMKQRDPYLSNLPLASVHMGELRLFIKARIRQSRKSKSIYLALGIVRHRKGLEALRAYFRVKTVTARI